MRGRERPINHAIRSLQTDLQRLTNSPLKEVALYLGEVLNDITGQQETGQAGANVQPVVTEIQRVLRKLPTTFDKRFLFDAILLRNISNTWSPLASINSLLVPRIGSDWGHATVCLPVRCHPSQRGGELRVRHLDLILMPGEDRLEDIDLLSYGWIVHEVAHNFFFRHNSVFEAESRTILERKIRRLKLAAILVPIETLLSVALGASSNEWKSSGRRPATTITGRTNWPSTSWPYGYSALRTYRCLRKWWKVKTLILTQSRPGILRMNCESAHCSKAPGS